MGEVKRTTRQIGALCEEQACRYLTERGYKIRARNYTVKGGEIDIVAQDGEYIVFVEVKARSSDCDQRRFGRPSDAVTKEKKEHFRRAVREYLFRVGSRKKPRIDVIEIIMTEEGGNSSFDIKHFIGAF